MKRCSNITGYTDYLVELLGDKPFKKAPVRRVQVISYDLNKYAFVKIIGTEVRLEIKAGYLYSEAGTCGTVKRMNVRKLERMISQLPKWS